MPNRRATLPPIFGELRPSQIITTFGPGAVVDLRNLSVVLAGTEFWVTAREHEIDEPRLRSLLRVAKFSRPAVKSDGGLGGIPAFIFPRYLRCPRCKRLGRYDRTDYFRLDRQRFRCMAKHEMRVPVGGPLVFPARFVVACSDGHLDDFPWFQYVHRNNGSASCQPERLLFIESARSAAVADLFVKCEVCGARRTMEAAFGKRAQAALGRCTGARPWLGEGEREPCATGILRTTLRGASNLYFALIQSALSIPEWDDPIHLAIAHHEEQLLRVQTVKEISAGISGGFLPRLEGFQPEQIMTALAKRREQAQKRSSALELRHEEYLALCHPIDAGKSLQREFRTEHVDVPSMWKRKIKRVVIVRRLREVRALSGFSRIDSAYDLLADEDTEPEHFRIQRLSAKELNWRPAIELRGEGLFLELDEKAVALWEQMPAVVRRTSELETVNQHWRRARELPPAEFPGSRFVLLHSLAHILIQGLALDCGYSSTSIRERIYSCRDPETRMTGILLYTATPDSDGSLGGLADKGRPGNLEPLLGDALEHTRFCSSDPLCGYSGATELGGLNGAACHACLFISETSCERGNRYLDRAHVVDTVSQLGLAFF